MICLGAKDLHSWNNPLDLYGISKAEPRNWSLGVVSVGGNIISSVSQASSSSCPGVDGVVDRGSK